MIKCSLERFEEVKKIFPALNFIEHEKKIVGELSFHARYEDIGINGLSKWVIKQGYPNKEDCIIGTYSIEINFDQLNSKKYFLPKVIETDGKIQSLAKSLGKPLDDLHINESGTCCLGLFAPSDRLSLFDYILEYVYPYFVWQAYFDKFGEIPPCGECPHDSLKACKVRIKDEEIDLQLLLSKKKGIPKGSNRNSPCHCGSGKKYKKCCFGSDEKIEHEITEKKSNIGFFNKKKENIINNREKNFKK